MLIELFSGGYNKNLKCFLCDKNDLVLRVCRYDNQPQEYLYYSVVDELIQKNPDIFRILPNKDARKGSDLHAVHFRQEHVSKWTIVHCGYRVLPNFGSLIDEVVFVCNECSRAASRHGNLLEKLNDSYWKKLDDEGGEFFVSLVAKLNLFSATINIIRKKIKRLPKVHREYLAKDYKRIITQLERMHPEKAKVGLKRLKCLKKILV